jgi:hypothetical protein
VRNRDKKLESEMNDIKIIMDKYEMTEEKAKIITNHNVYEIVSKLNKR